MRRLPDGEAARGGTSSLVPLRRELMQRVVQSVESNVRTQQLNTLRRRRGRALCAAAATVAASLATAHLAGAALTTWDGGGTDPNFGNALNWTNDTVPAAGDVLMF